MPRSRPAKFRTPSPVHRPWLEVLEDRLQLGETLLGALTGLAWLESLAPTAELTDLPALASPRPLPAALAGFTASDTPAAPESLAATDTAPLVPPPAPALQVGSVDLGAPPPHAAAFGYGSLPFAVPGHEAMAQAIAPPASSASPVAPQPTAAEPASTFALQDLPAVAANPASVPDVAPAADAAPLTFDRTTGQLAIQADSSDHTVRETITPAGYLELTRAGGLHSSDPTSAAFDRTLAGATADTLHAIRFAGGADDQLTLSAPRLPDGLSVRAAGAEVVAGDVTAAGPVAIQAAKVTVTGAVHAPAVSLSATGWAVVEVTGEVSAAQGDTGGQIAIVADKFSNAGQVHADGTAGGQIIVHAGNVLNAGPLTADATGPGAGGAVRVAFTGAYVGTVAGVTSADGGPGPGGYVALDGGTTGHLFSSGRHEATGAAGGVVDLLGREVVLAGATVDASGFAGGGAVRVGGDFHGRNAAVPNAAAVTVTAATTIHADARHIGAGGRVAVWSDGATSFEGSVSARGGPAGGAGGLVEVSGKGDLSYGGSADAGARAGRAGTLLLDPKNIVISAAPVGIFPQFDLIDPHPTPMSQFGLSNAAVLNSGNVAVANSSDDFGGTSAGVAYLFDGLTGRLLSSLVGSSPNDAIGNSQNGVVVLSNGNYVIPSIFWSGNRGAVTWANGLSGVSGVVSALNSLTGSAPLDRIGEVVPLSNGAYVVASPFWNGNRGIATWGDGTSGVRGIASEMNSLVGNNSNDDVGNIVVPLRNGNFVVDSSAWSNNRGAVTWGDGAIGIRGFVSSANSLVGSNPSDAVGHDGVAPLSNGNFVVRSSGWAGNRGAVTWGNGTTGITGEVSEVNSLVGRTQDEGIGAWIVLLSNGSYVVQSPGWNHMRGAVTWRSGTTGVTGFVSASVSLVGVNDGDGLEQRVIPLTNGNYVVLNPYWDGRRGAVTWGSGVTGVRGNVADTNSLTDLNPNRDFALNASVLPLSNGNYVVQIPFWTGRGAVTWGNGSSGVIGPVSANNSLVGNIGDDVGYRGVFPLPNGNYVVCSPGWGGRRGAATWGDGAAGTTGLVSETNSIFGSAPDNSVCGDGVTALPNGNYVVSSTFWNAQRGAATWGNGTSALVGPVSSANSLVGTNIGDRVGEYIATLTNGNYVVVSRSWNGSRGAATWGNGLAGVVGTVSANNSLVGTQQNEAFGTGTLPLPNGNYIVDTPTWNNYHGAVTWGSGSAGVVGMVSPANSLVGDNYGDRVGGSFDGRLPGIFLLSDGNYLVNSPDWDGRRGAATWVNGATGGTLDELSNITAQNSLLGQSQTSGLRLLMDAPPLQAFMAWFREGNVGRISLGIPSLNRLTYARGQDRTIAIPPTFLTHTLNTGTDVVLQASNDITVEDPIVVHAGGHGGALTLQAGRSITLNAGITTDNGPLTLIANDTLAHGVVDAQRDPGGAFITMAGGTALDVGAAPLDIELRDGAGLTYSSSRAVNLQTLTAGSVTVSNNGPSPGSDLRLGPVTSGGPQTYSSPNGLTVVAGDLAAAGSSITFTDSVSLGAGVRIDAGSGTVDFAGAGTQTLQTGDGATVGNFRHDGPGTVQLLGALTVTGTFLQSAGTFDANDQPVSVGRAAVLTGGTYLAGTAYQTFAGGLVVAGGTFTSSDGPMAVLGGVTLTDGSFGGEGTADTLTVYRGTVTPGGDAPGVLTVLGAVTFNPLTTFNARLDGPDPGAGYAQLQAGGPLDLGGAALALALGFEPPVESAFTIVTTADPAGVTGTFAGLPEGAVFTQDGVQFQITYQGGPDGHSVVLTRIA